MKITLITTLSILFSALSIYAQDYLARYQSPVNLEEVKKELVMSPQLVERAEEKIISKNVYEKHDASSALFSYIIWGTEKELQADGILDDNQTWSYQEVSHFGREEMEKFVQVETDDISSINIPGVLKYLLTVHDKNSYKIKQGKGVEFTIVEKEKFWTNGNFLVVVTE